MVDNSIRFVCHRPRSARVASISVVKKSAAASDILEQLHTIGIPKEFPEEAVNLWVSHLVRRQVYAIQ